MNGIAPVPHRAPRPVFVDHSGRRRRLVVASGVGLGMILLAGLVVLLLGLSGGSGLHVPGFPDFNPANGAAVGPSGTPVPEPTEDPATLDGGVIAPGASAAPTRSIQRHVPTQTPSHPPKPTKT